MMNERNSTGAKRQFHRRERAVKPAQNDGLTDDFLTDDDWSRETVQSPSDPSDPPMDVSRPAESAPEPSDAADDKPTVSPPPSQENASHEEETTAHRPVQASPYVSPFEQPSQDKVPDTADTFFPPFEATEHGDLPAPFAAESAEANETNEAPFFPPFEETEDDSPSFTPKKDRGTPKQSRTVDYQKLSKITTALFLVGAAAAVCLVFFFYTLFSVRNARKIPRILDLQQVSATDSAVLLSWNTSVPAESYRVRLLDGDSAWVSKSDIPYAVVRDLQPNQTYHVEVAALKDGKACGAASVACSTASYCEITEVKVEKIGSRSVRFTWKYEGADEGFEAIVYALDKNGKRHLTSEKAVIPAGEKSECTIGGLASEMKYTVAVMPLTKYGTAGKSNFQTGKYSDKLKDITIIRFVICASNVKDAVQVQNLNRIKPSSPYKASLLLNGKTDKQHKVEMSLLITDTKGNLVSERPCGEVYTNPDGKEWYIHRAYLFDFNTPKKLGEYYLYLTVNGQTVYRTKFAVEN